MTKFEAKISSLKEAVKTKIEVAKEVQESLDGNEKKTLRIVRKELWLSFEM